MNTKIRLYAYANAAIDAANSLKETGTAIYVIGLFNPIEASIPDKSTLNEVKEFFRLTAYDLASSESTFYAVEDVKDLDFTFGEVQDDLIGSGKKRIFTYSDSYPEDAPKFEDRDAKPTPSLGLYGHYEDILWGPELFEQNPTQQDSSLISRSDTTAYNLMLLSGCLCINATNPFYLEQAYLDLGFKEEDIYFYSYKVIAPDPNDPTKNKEYDYHLNRVDATRNGTKFANDSDLAFSIASQTMIINGEETDVLFVIARGSFTDYEFFKDKFCIADKDFYGIKAYDWVWEFEEDIFAGLEDYYKDHSELGTKPLKILVAGHSLGGAAANLVAAKLDLTVGKDNWYSKNISIDDICAITFGAIDSIEDQTMEGQRIQVPVSGFDNIYNIYNILDTFGPNGNDVFTANGNTMYGKFGRLFTFENNMEGIVENSSCKTHEIIGYVYAVKESYLQYVLNKKRSRVIIRCPVDVTVMHGDEVVCQILSDEIVSIDPSIAACVEDSHKTLIIPQDSDYIILLSATNNGTMNYIVQNLDSENISSSVFVDIALETDKTFLCELPADTDVEEIDLFVTDKDGNIIFMSEFINACPTGNQVPAPLTVSISRESSLSTCSRLLTADLSSSYMVVGINSNILHIFLIGKRSVNRCICSYSLILAGCRFFCY